MSLDEVNNLPLSQIQDRYSIPNKIDSKARSNIPSDTPMQYGEVNPDVRRGLPGGGRQHQIRNWDSLPIEEQIKMFNPDGKLNNN